MAKDVKEETFRVNRSLVPLKFALFLHAGGVTTMQTFLPVYFKHMGLNISQISVIQSIAPIFQFLGVTASGLFSEKTGEPKNVLYVSIISALLFLNVFLIIPSSSSSMTVYNPIRINCSSVHVNISQNFSDCIFHCESNSTLDFVNSYCSMNEKTLCRLHSVNQHTFLCDGVKDGELYFVLNYTMNADYRSCDSVCDSILQTTEADGTVVFVFALLLTVGFKMSYFIVYCFLDDTSTNLEKLRTSDYGRQSFWLILGTTVIPPIAGYFIEATTPVSDNYYAAFYIFDVFYIAVIIAVWRTDVKAKPREDKLNKEFFNLFKSPEFISFFSVVFVLSVLWGFKYDFTSLYLKELHASSMIMSLVPTVMGISAFPFLFASNWWVKKIGSVNLLICSFCAYTFGYTAYSYLGNPWWCLLCELMTIFTAQLNWVAIVQYNNEITPEVSKTDVITILASIHYGLGISVGSVIGGFFMSEFGGRKACRLMAIIACISGIFYTCFIWITRRMKDGPKTDNLHVDEEVELKLRG